MLFYLYYYIILCLHILSSFVAFMTQFQNYASMKGRGGWEGSCFRTIKSSISPPAPHPYTTAFTEIPMARDATFNWKWWRGMQGKGGENYFWRTRRILSFCNEVIFELFSVFNLFQRKTFKEWENILKRDSVTKSV